MGMCGLPREWHAMGWIGERGIGLCCERLTVVAVRLNGCDLVDAW